MSFDVTQLAALLLVGPQLWRLNGGTWATVPSATQPSGHLGTQMATDFSGLTLLYGGIPLSSSSTPNADETWLWNGQDWTLMTPSFSPGGLARYGLAADLNRGRFVLYGGSQNVYQPTAVSGATWEFDGATWQSMPATGPGQRERLSMCFDASLGQTVLFGGEGPFGADDITWLYDGVQWRQAPVTGPRPSPRVDAAFTYDWSRQICLLTGGNDPTTMIVFDDTWEFDGTSWRQTGVGPAPSRTRASACYDFLRQRSILFGGRTASTAILADTFEYAAFTRNYGLGCLGSFGRPTLVRGLPPRLGNTGSLLLTNLNPTPSVCAFTYGYSHSQWAFGSLPASLAFAGMPGCVAYASADEVVLVPTSAGQATWTFAVPANPQLFGLEVYVQGVSVDPARNAAGLVTSNGAILTLGW